MWFKNVCVLLTRKCNANCDICCQGCSNTIDEKVDVKRTLEIIELLKNKEAIRTVGVTGGEPFLFFAELQDILKESKKMGMNITFTTNGFWGKDYSSAFQKLEKLKELGVEFFTISVDDFHEKYVPYQSVRNIVDIAKKVNMKVVVNTVSTKRSKRLKGVLEELQDTFMLCSLLEIPCAPAGHAASRINEDDFIYMEELPTGICELMNYFTIMPNGDVFPCCSEAGMTPALYMGNIHQNSIDELLGNFYSNKVCYLLAHHGPRYIYDKFLNDADIRELRSKFVSSCDMCYVMFNGDETRSKIIDRIAAENKQ